MEPFVARFMRPISVQGPEGLFMEYDAEKECVVFADSALAIESPEALPEFTGSICTRATNDPTADEASDR